MKDSVTRNYPYSESFHLLRHQETSYAAERIISILLRHIPDISSAVDVGCGVGTFLSTLNEHGIESILGLDGDWVDNSMLVISRNNFRTTDLTRPPDLGRTYDLAICLEVAEHLAPENEQSFMGWLCRLSDCILFSAAVPMQGGVHHVNEAWQSYWAHLFAVHGFRYIDLIRPLIWEDQAIPFWYRQNTLVYVKEGGLRAVDQSSLPLPLPLDLIHPELYLMRADGSRQKGILQRLIRRLDSCARRLK